MGLTEKDKKFVKKLRNKMKKFEIALQKHIKKHKREEILRGLE